MTTIRSLDDLDGQPHANVFPTAEPKTIRLRLAAGEEVAPHSHPDREVVLYLVDGTLDLRVGSERHEVTAGDVVRFDGERTVAPHAVEDTTAVIVLAARAAD